MIKNFTEPPPTKKLNLYLHAHSTDVIK